MPRFWLSMKPCCFTGIEGMPAFHFKPFAADGFHDGLFGARLGGPAFLIGGKAQVAVGDHDDRFGHGNILTLGRARVHSRK